MVCTWFRRRLLLMIAGIALALLSPLGLAVPAAAATTTFALGTVPSALVCVDATTCYAVGQQSNSSGLVFTVTNGNPGTPATISSVYGLASIACVSSTQCFAAGDIQEGYANYIGAVLPITSGAAGTPTAIDGTYSLNSVACPTSTKCFVVGGSSNYRRPGSAG